MVTVAASVCLAWLPAPASASHSQPDHWNRNTPTVTAVAQVYVEDFTGSRWPVYRGVLKWDDRPTRYRPYYKNANTCDRETLHCIPVREGNYGATGWDGLTTYSINAANHIVHNSMLVRFNNSYSSTEAMREALVCHELGHASGPLAEYPSTTASCMHPSKYYPNPTTHDFDTISAIYNH